MKLVKTVAALAALTMASSAFAEVNLEASNKLKSDVVELNHSDLADETTNTFPGIKNVINAEVTSDHVDAMVEGVIKFYDVTSQNDVALAWDGEISDWYVEARVLDDKLTLGFHDNIHPEGSYLPVWDDNIGYGNIGSEGFSLVYRPIEGLRLGLSLPFGPADEGVNWLKVDGKQEDALDDTEKTTNIRLGAIYEMDIAEFGLAIQDVLDSDERSIGAYVYSAGFFGKVEGVDFRAGFAHSWGTAVVEDLIPVEVALLPGDDPVAVGFVAGENLWNVAFEISDIIPVDLAIEAAGNTNSDDSLYDLYAGVKVGFGINEQLYAFAQEKTLLDLGDTEYETALDVKAGVDITVTEKDKIEVAVEYSKLDKDWKAKFPCYWKHTF